MRPTILFVVTPSTLSDANMILLPDCSPNCFNVTAASPAGMLNNFSGASAAKPGVTVYRATVQTPASRRQAADARRDRTDDDGMWGRVFMEARAGGPAMSGFRVVAPAAISFTRKRRIFRSTGFCIIGLMILAVTPISRACFRLNPFRPECVRLDRLARPACRWWRSAGVAFTRKSASPHATARRR